MNDILKKAGVCAVTAASIAIGMGAGYGTQKILNGAIDKLEDDGYVVFNSEGQRNFVQGSIAFSCGLFSTSVIAPKIAEAAFELVRILSGK